MSVTPQTTLAGMRAGGIRAAMPPARLSAAHAGAPRNAAHSPAGIPRKDLADLAGLPVTASNDEIFDAIAPKVAAKLAGNRQDTARPAAPAPQTHDDALYAAMYGPTAAQPVFI